MFQSRAEAKKGTLSLASYWIALWAFTRAPVALVAALRETSVLFALLIATLLLREQAGRWRIAAGLYPEHDLFIQSMKLKNTLRFLRGEDLITHLGLEYYD